MRALRIAFLFLAAACGTQPIAAPSPSDAPSTPTAAPSVAPTPEPTATALPEPTPNRTSEPVPPPKGPNLEPPKVTLLATTFPISAPTQSLVRVAATDQLRDSAKFGLDEYLMQLNQYRSSGFMEERSYSPLRNPFRDVVLRSVRETARPGVTREFVLESVRVDAAYQKPWGTQAVLEVTATIRDRVVSGQAADELETGRLRLGGDRRMQVIDGWNAAQGRWWNGFAGPSRDAITNYLDMSMGWHLRTEMWLKGMAPETYFGPAGETAFGKARNEWLKTFDRSKVVERLLDGVSAEIVRFDTYTELGDGLITVRLRGTVLMADGAGTVTKAPFERLVRVLQQSWGYPGGHMIVDEEASLGVWRSGGDIALKDVDRTFG